MKWYVIFVNTGKEMITQRWMELFLKNNSFVSCIPRKLISEKRRGIVKMVEKVFFPGYVFIKIDMLVENYYILKSIPSCCLILKNGDYCSSVPNEQMNFILSLTNDDDIVTCSKVYIENSKVVIVDGPLKGMDGLIKKIDKRKKRAVIELEFLNEIRLINLGIEFIEKNETK